MSGKEGMAPNEVDFKTKEELKMKKSRLVLMAFVLACILGFYGLAFAGGGEPCPGCCNNPPLPRSGQFLFGTFTVARDKSACGLSTNPTLNGYDVQISLRHKLIQVHLFSFHAPLGTGDLCGYDAATLEATFAKYPCALEVGEAFGFDPAKYFPVISDLYIAQQDFCGTPDEMISGFVTIRLVPIK